MKKLLALITVFVILGIVASTVLAVPTELPAAYYVHSDNKILKSLFEVKHEFTGVFSVELTPTQLGLLKAMGIETEPVKIYKIDGRPVCGDGKCSGGETLENCPNDCAPVICNPHDEFPWGIMRVNGGLGGSSAIVAVLDTGIDTDHPDLLHSYSDCITKVTHYKQDSRNCEDGEGHGTHVAGIIAANGKIKGVVPEAKLMIVKVCDRRGWCYGDDIAAGIRYATDKGANIISMSFGSDSMDSQIIAAIDYAVDKGVLPIAAAGNDGHLDGYGSIDYPAAYVKVVAVGAIDSDDNYAYFTSQGINDVTTPYENNERDVEFGAPGVNVESTWNDGCYKYLQGTSMATPHVSGLAAKLWQGSASTTRTYLQNLAKNNDILPTDDDIYTGFGLPVAT